jgi:TetR/AcrR family transcriptional repressor of nem operon
MEQKTVIIDTKEQILAIGRSVVQSQGYNALSFRDIAKAVGIKSASIHYHFPTKGDLGAALARRYTDDARALLDTLSIEPADIGASLDTYIAVFRAALANENRMCLCGILIAERDELPDIVRAEVDRFTDVNVAWLQTLLGRWTPGRSAEDLHQQAVAIFSAIEGAQLVARGRADLAVFDATIAAYRAAGLMPPR